jgi:hypothetical protein
VPLFDNLIALFMYFKPTSFSYRRRVVALYSPMSEVAEDNFRECILLESLGRLWLIARGVMDEDCETGVSTSLSFSRNANRPWQLVRLGIETVIGKWSERL